MQTCSRWSVDAGLDEYLFGKAFVHRYRAAQGIGTRVADSQQIERRLEFSVLPFSTVESEKGNVSQTAKLDDIGSQKTV